MDADEFAARERKGRKDFSLRLTRFPSLDFQPSTINFGNQSEVSNSTVLAQPGR